MRRRLHSANLGVTAGVGELYLYGTIGGYWGEGHTPKSVQAALERLTAEGAKELRIYVHSPGGNALDSFGIYSVIKRFPGKKTMVVEGIAASGASVILMAGDLVQVNRVSMVMIHEAAGECYGTASKLRRAADGLDALTASAISAYAGKTGLSASELAELCAAETWMTAEEAVRRGFADEVIDGDLEEQAEDGAEASAAAAAAARMLSTFKHPPPEALRLLKLSRPSGRTIPAGTVPAPKEPIMLKTLLAALLALPETATEEQVIGGVQALQADAVKAKEREQELQRALAADSHEKAMATAAGLKEKAGQADQALAQLAALKGEQLVAKRTALLDAAAKDGRLTPAKRAELAGDSAPAWAKDPSALESFLSCLPVAPPAPREPPAAKPAELSPEDLAVAKQLGIDPKDLASFKAQK